MVTSHIARRSTRRKVIDHKQRIGRQKCCVFEAVGRARPTAGKMPGVESGAEVLLSQRREFGPKYAERTSQLRFSRSGPSPMSRGTNEKMVADVPTFDSLKNRDTALIIREILPEL